jgi:peptidoglycan/LPS O-acetylase OafA/YrhL
MLLLLGLAWSGLDGGPRQWPQAQNPGQRAQTIAQLGYGLLSLLGILVIFRGRRWARHVWVAWAVCVTVAAGLAPVVWGETGWGTGLLAAVAGLLVVVAVIALLRIGGARAERAPGAGGRGQVG